MSRASNDVTMAVTTADSASAVSFADFARIDIRVGTIVSAEDNVGARNPAYILSIDFGAEIGVKLSSAQLQKDYEKEQLIGRKVAAVVNLPPLRVAGWSSEVLTLAAVEPSGRLVLIEPAGPINNGAKIF